MIKTKTLYQVREFVESQYSAILGCKLRQRSAALRLMRRLKKNGREVFITPVKISV